ncbi:phage tail length tape measure family protein [Rhizobium paknamense]|uniref:Bacteriophage tail tape measure N-terminal domain-containing protein n=1 Tax=Rhizobium paknamense TaxID=1206817 RepID=A0ABU0I916_9HYPH|nr:phage tail length tape measure family protein [Rhizobium paknamense]MDQ0454720.1 hypothetical protein [Rhizobium paknamense]
MVAPLKLAATVTLDASQVPAGAQATKQALAGIGTEAAASATKVQALIEQQAGLSRPAANTNSRAAEIAAYGAELDRLQAKFDPMFAAQQKYQNALQQIDQAQRMGVISASQAIDLKLKETNAYNALASAAGNAAAANKRYAEAVVAKATITPDRGADIAAYGQELDRLRAKYNPLYAVTINYKSAVAEIRQAHAAGAISADEMTTAISRQRQATLASIDAIKGRNTAIKAGQGGANTSFAATSTMYQFQDIATTAAMGMSPAMIGLQQGSQIAGSYAGMSMKEAAKTTGAALTSLLSPTSMAAIALTAGAAAAIQFGMSLSQSSKDAKKLEDVLGSHAATVERLRKQYGDLGSAIKSAMPIGGAGFTDASARNEIATLETAIKKQSESLATSFGGSLKGGFFGSSTAGLDKLLATTNSPFQKQINDLLASVRSGKGDLGAFEAQTEAAFNELRKSSDAPAKLNAEMERLTAAAQDAFSVSPKFEPFQAEIAKLTLGLKNGNADLSDFATNVSRIGQLNGLQKVADEVILASKGAVELAETLREVRAIIQQMDREDTRSGLSAQRETARYVNLRDASAREADTKFAAEQQMALARTNAEKLAAIEARVRASARQDGDSGGGLQARIDRELTAERNRQAVEARNAATARAQSLDQTIAQQRLELSLVGQTTAAREEQLFAEQQIMAIKQEAARTGTAVDQQEINLIRQKAAEYGRLKGQIEAANAVKDLTTTNARLQFQVGIAGNSKADQEALLAQYDLEKKIREIGASGDKAEALRRATAAQIAYNAQLSRTSEAWSKVRSSAEGAIDGIVDGLASGKPGDALKSISADIQKTFLSLAVSNPLKNALTGSNYGTLSDVGGVKGIFGKLFGGGQSVGQMAVTAGTVMINGGVSGTGIASAGLQAANSNGTATAQSSTLAGLGQSMSFGGNYKGAGVDPRLTDILNTAAQRTPGFKVDAISGVRAGDPRFHGQGLATDIQLTDLATGKQLGNYQDATSFSAYEKFAQTARAVQMEKYPELANQFRWGGYFGGGKGTYGALDTMHFDLGGNKVGMGGGSWDKGLTSAQASLWPGIESSGSKAVTALNQLATGSAGATQNLGVFGNGLSQLGNGLASLLSGNASGLSSSILSSLTSSSFTANTTLGSFLTNGFDGGGYTGAGGRLEPAGVVHKGEVVWSQDDVARAGGAHVVDAMRLGYRGYDKGGVVGGSAASSAASNDNGSGNIIVNNYSSANVQTEQTTDERGRRQTQFVISDTVGTAIGTKGGTASKTIERQYGIKKKGISR